MNQKVLELPGKWGNKEQANSTAWITGRTPREIRRLRKWLLENVDTSKDKWEELVNKKDLTNWVESRAAVLTVDFSKWVEQLDSHDMYSFRLFLDQFFSPRFAGKAAERSAGWTLL